MTDDGLLEFIGAAALLCVAHVLRCYRQTLLFPDRQLPWRFDLLLGLALSQAVNVLLPWRVGDALRVLYVSHRYRLRFPYVAATVLAERLSDVLVVAALALALARWAPQHRHTALAVAVTLALVGAAFAGLAAAVAYSTRGRRLLWRAVGVFNKNIRFGIVDLAWSFAQLVCGGSLLRRRYLVLTAAMWEVYLLSYLAFARAMGVSAVDTSVALLGPDSSLLDQIDKSQPADLGFDYALLAFAALPIAVVLLYGLARNSRKLWRSFGLVRDYGFKSMSIGQPIAGDRFADRANYFAFLESHFAGSNAMVSKFSLIASADVLVHKLLPGGSDAVTALVEVDDTLKIRKCAVGGAGDKLAEQARWLREHGAALPLCGVIGESRRDGVTTFDMPYLLTARDFYEVIHSAPLAHNEALLGDVIEQQHAFHRRTAGEPVDDATLDAYLQQKVIANARQVHAFALALFPDGVYRINGVEHDLAQWNLLTDPAWLRGQVRDRATAVVHGDLTIENIIVSSEVARGWYLIDPNPSNVFNTPLIDWAKLMQSLHLGYEGLNRGSPCEVVGNDIRQLFLRSGAYSQLHAFVAARLRQQLGAEAMREIAFHELVNYLRLTPYKIRHQPQKALTFFACTSLLLSQYVADRPAPRPAPLLVPSPA